MGYSLDGKYTVTHVATEVAWYIPVLIWIRGGASGRSNGGILERLVGWVYISRSVVIEF